MHSSNKVFRFFLCSVAALLLVFVLLITIIGIKNYRSSIIFYNLDQNISLEIQKQINSSAGKKYNFISLQGQNIKADALKNKKLFKHASLIFTDLNYSSRDFFIKSAQPLSSSLLTGMPASLADSLQVEEGKIKYLPLLCDFYQLDINYPYYLQSKCGNINFFNDLETFAGLAGSPKSPLLFAGKDDRELINVFGMFMEASYGTEAYKRFSSDIYNFYEENFKDNHFNQLFTDYINKLALESAAFEASLKKIQTLYSKNLIDKEVFNLDTQSVLLYLNNNYSAAAFLKLSDHRKINSKNILSYKSIYMPSFEENYDRSFLAPVYVLAKMSGGKDIDRIITNLSINKQTELSTKTGLAPVQKNCSVADHQADDVRYWLAASNGPSIPLCGTLPSSDARRIFADYIRQNIKESR